MSDEKDVLRMTNELGMSRRSLRGGGLTPSELALDGLDRQLRHK